MEHFTVRPSSWISRLLFLLFKNHYWETISYKTTVSTNKCTQVPPDSWRFFPWGEVAQKSFCKQRTLALSASDECWGILTQKTSAPLGKQHYWLPRPCIWELFPAKKQSGWHGHTLICSWSMKTGQSHYTFCRSQGGENIPLRMAMPLYVSGPINSKAPCSHTGFQKTKTCYWAPAEYCRNGRNRLSFNSE